MSPDPIADAYAALLNGDPRAPERLVALCLVPLKRRLRRCYLMLPTEVLQDAAVDALLALLSQPHHFNPSRSSLMTYLTMQSDYRVLSWLRNQRRRRELYVGGVEEVEYWSERLRATDASEDPVTALLRLDLERMVHNLLPDERDRRLLELACSGRTSILEYAEVLGITQLPPEEQRREVKRNRDRVVKRIQRSRLYWSEPDGPG
jgi:RNA polymerase sigma-70 factor (ECF subfamily)